MFMLKAEEISHLNNIKIKRTTILKQNLLVKNA